MGKSINDARYTMWATVIPRLETNVATQATGPGHFTFVSDPDSGEVKTVWVAGTAGPTGITAGPSGIIQAQYEIQCYARGYTALGYRSSANREFLVKGEYNESEAIQMDYPASVILNHQSLVTNLRTSSDVTDRASFSWLDDDGYTPVVWEIQGITPVHDPFGKLIRNTTVLKRAEIQ